MIRWNWRLAVLTVGIIFATWAGAGTGALHAGTLRTITVDGEFEDWEGIAPLAADPTGDTSSDADIDFGKIWVANDENALYVRIELGRETLFQDASLALGGIAEGNDIHLYLDGDNNTATGLEAEGLGAELEIAFGPRAVKLHTPQTQDITLNEAGSYTGPTHSGDQFEIRIGFDSTPGFDHKVGVVTAKTITIFLRDKAGSDRIPDSGTLSYTIAPGATEPVTPLDMGRADAGDIRILSHNVLHTGMAENPDPFTRILQSVKPDIVSWQEVRPNVWTSEQAMQFVAAALPLPDGEHWSVAAVNDCVTISRFPILDHSNSDENLVVHIDLPDDRADTDLVIFNVHTPAGNREVERDAEHDRISSIWRDLINAEGPFEVDPGVAVAMMGDFNMVGFVRQLNNLRDGDLVDNEKFGPDFSPGRKMGSLANAPTRHTHTSQIYTWRDPPQRYAPGKLDFILYSADAATLKRNYTLQTDEMPAAALEAAGLQAKDSDVSDHLVMVVDFDFKRPSPSD